MEIMYMVTHLVMVICIIGILYFSIDPKAEVEEKRKVARIHGSFSKIKSGKQVIIPFYPMAENAG